MPDGLGGFIGGLLGSYGDKLKVPPLTGVDAQAVQQKTVAGNMATVPAAEQFASEANKFTSDQIAKMLGAVIPGYQGMFAKAGTNVADLLSGKLPTDVVNQVSDLSNARNFGSGTQGSGFGENLTLKDLGLTSLQAEQMGLSQFGNLLGMAESVTPNPSANFAMSFLSPQQQVQNAYAQEQMQFSRDLLAAKAAAAPDPNDMAMIQSSDIFSEIGGAYGGSKTTPGMIDAGGGIPSGVTGFGGSGFTGQDSQLSTMGAAPSTGGGGY